MRFIKSHYQKIILKKKIKKCIKCSLEIILKIINSIKTDNKKEHENASVNFF